MNIFGENTEASAEGLTNPLLEDLDCDSNNIVNLGPFNVDLNNFVIATEGSLSTQQGDIGTLQTKTQLLTTGIKSNPNIRKPV